MINSTCLTDLFTRSLISKRSGNLKGLPHIFRNIFAMKWPTEDAFIATFTVFRNSANGTPSIRRIIYDSSLLSRPRPGRCRSQSLSCQRIWSTRRLQRRPRKSTIALCSDGHTTIERHSRAVSGQRPRKQPISYRASSRNSEHLETLLTESEDWGLRFAL